MNLQLAGLVATATAAAAMAAALTGPVARVLEQVRRRDHPIVRKFDFVAGQYRRVLAWSD